MKRAKEVITTPKQWLEKVEKKELIMTILTLLLLYFIVTKKQNLWILGTIIVVIQAVYHYLTSRLNKKFDKEEKTNE